MIYRAAIRIQKPNSFWGDPRLSWRAKGLLYYLLVSGETDAKDLVAISKNSYDQIATIIKELQDAGYLVKTKVVVDGKAQTEALVFAYVPEEGVISTLAADQVVRFRVDGHRVAGEVGRTPVPIKKKAPPARKRKDVGPSDWEWKWSERLLDHMVKEGHLAPAPAKAIETPETRKRLIKAWATEMRKINKLDGISKDDIRSILQWLVKEDGFWLSSGFNLGYIRTRSKSGFRKIDTIKAQWENWRDGKTGTHNSKRPVHGAKYTLAERDGFLKHDPALEPYFLKFADDPRHQAAEYIYRNDGTA